MERTQFELGRLPVQRGNSIDWQSIADDARAGRLDTIPADIYVRYYGNLKRIACDHLAPTGGEREVFAFIGPTGTGKSRRAWNEAGLDAYPKVSVIKYLPD